jgi:Putative beta-barrel porin 2
VTLLDDGFKRTESELSATWRISAKSTLDARLARVEHRSNQFAQRSFSGNAGRLDYRWAAAPKLALEAALSRALEPWSDLESSYRVEDRRSLGAAWQIAARTVLRASLARTQVDYRNPVSAPAGTTRSDTLRAAELAAEWRVQRNVALNAAVQRYRQASTDPGGGFEGTIATLGGTLGF